MKLTNTQFEILRSLEVINLKSFIKSPVNEFYVLNHLEFNINIKLTQIGFKRIINKLKKLELIEIKIVNNNTYLKLTSYGIDVIIENTIYKIDSILKEPYSLDSYGDGWFIAYEGREISELDINNKSLLDYLYQLQRLAK